MIQSVQKKVKPGISDSLRGGLWQLGCVLCLSSMATLVKILGQDLAPEDIVFHRCIFGIVLLTMIWPARQRPRLWPKTGRPKVIGALLLRGFFSVAALLSGFYAVTYLPLSVSATIGFSRVFYVIALGAWLLGERAPRQQKLTSVVGFFGVLVVMRPWNHGLDGPLIFSILSAFFAACGTIVTRYLSQRRDALTVIFGSALLALPFALPLAWGGVEALNGFQIGSLLMLTLLGLGGQWCNVTSLRYAGPGALASYSYLRLLMAIFYGYIVFAEIPDIWTLLGAVIILSANGYVLYIQARQQAKGSRCSENYFAPSGT